VIALKLFLSRVYKTCPAIAPKYTLQISIHYFQTRKIRYFYVSCTIFSVEMNIITVTQFELKEAFAITLFLTSINKALKVGK